MTHKTAMKRRYLLSILADKISCLAWIVGTNVYTLELTIQVTPATNASLSSSWTTGPLTLGINHPLQLANDTRIINDREESLEIVQCVQRGRVCFRRHSAPRSLIIYANTK